mgnify:CR=1 FL=1
MDASNAQKKLSLRATQDLDHRFEDLYGLLYNPVNGKKTKRDLQAATV